MIKVTLTCVADDGTSHTHTFENVTFAMEQKRDVTQFKDAGWMVGPVRTSIFMTERKTPFFKGNDEMKAGL